MVKVLYNTLQKYNNPLFEYGLEAASHLVLCRQILSCSYVFGYFLKDNERDMFDFLQQGKSRERCLNNSYLRGKQS